VPNRQGSVTVRRLANPVTLCDGHGFFFVAASGQIRMAADRILGDSGAVAVVVETDDHAEKVATARPGLPALPHVWAAGALAGRAVSGAAAVSGGGAAGLAAQGPGPGAGISDGETRSAALGPGCRVFRRFVLVSPCGLG
jgi:hypothetical protein